MKLTCVCVFDMTGLTDGMGIELHFFHRSDETHPTPYDPSEAYVKDHKVSKVYGIAIIKMGVHISQTSFSSPNFSQSSCPSSYFDNSPTAQLAVLTP